MPTEGVDSRGRSARVAVKPHVVPAQGVDGDEQDAAYGIPVEEGRLRHADHGVLGHRHHSARGVGHSQVELERALSPGALERDRGSAIGSGPAFETPRAEQTAIALARSLSRVRSTQASPEAANPNVKMPRRGRKMRDAVGWTSALLTWLPV